MDPISIALHFNGCHKRRIHSALHKVITLTQPPRAVGQIAKLVAASAPFSGAHSSWVPDLSTRN